MLRQLTKYKCVEVYRLKTLSASSLLLVSNETHCPICPYSNSLCNISVLMSSQYLPTVLNVTEQDMATRAELSRSGLETC